MEDNMNKTPHLLALAFVALAAVAPAHEGREPKESRCERMDRPARDVCRVVERVAQDRGIRLHDSPKTVIRVEPSIGKKGLNGGKVVLEIIW